ncbi:MAG: hypothetical protein AAGC77_14450 [Pseudomonadota bacterium]
MRGALIFGIIVFFIGMLIGERYGAPAFVTGVTDQGFQAIEEPLGVKPTSDDDVEGAQ